MSGKERIGTQRNRAWMGLLCSFALAGSLLAGCSSEPKLNPDALVNSLAGESTTGAFSTLDQARPSLVTDALVRGTTNPNPKIRAQCAKLLARKKDINTLPALRRMLEDEDSTVRSQACLAWLSMTETQDALAVLRSPGLTEVSKATIISSLFQNEPKFGLDPDFVAWVLDPRLADPLRLLAFEAMRDFSGHSRFPGLDDDPPRVAARARVLAAAHTYLHDDHADIRMRCAAMIILATCGGPYTLSEITSMTDESEQLRQAAYQAMGSSRNQKAIAQLEKIAKDQNRNVEDRKSALRGLGEFSTTRMPPNRSAWNETRFGNPVRILLDSMRDSDETIRLTSISVMGRYNEPQWIPEITQLRQQEPSERVQQALDGLLRQLNRRNRRRRTL